MSTLRIDLETYSSVDLKKCGVHKYVESDDFEILLLAYAFDDEAVRVLDIAQGCLESEYARVVAAIKDPAIIKTAYNAAFEIACLSKHLAEPLDVTQWRCTSVHALYLGLPGNLGDVGRVLGLAEDKQKLGSGWSLIRYFCIPCKPSKANHGRTRNLPKHDPQKWELFIEYCRRDVETEREIARKLARFPVPDKEWKLWHLDQRMMNKGVLIDRALVNAAIEADEIVKQRLTAEAVKLTGLDNPNSRDQLLAWLQEEMDDEIADLTKKTVPKLLEATDSKIVERVLKIRQELAKTSVSKYHAMARAVCQDGAIRGLTQFYGANRTGRWAGRIVQVQNLPSNKLRDLDLARELLRAGQYDELDFLYGSVPDVLSQLIRTAFVARLGTRFIPVDFSAIEARVIAWLAWCEWRLEVFKTHGKIYEASAEQMFKLPPGSVTKKSPYRQKGKIAELALGFGGAANALKTMGALDMGITEEDLDPIKEAWRAANPEIASFDKHKPGLWLQLERAATRAVVNKTSVVVPVASGRAQLVFTYESGFLFIRLPSGRRLAYVKPRIEGEDLYRELANGSRFLVASAGSLTYEGVDQRTKQWTRISSYGGKLCIAEGSLVLARSGWTKIENITPIDQVWDGVEWVSTEGAVCNGTQEVIQAYGAWMTPDHDVMSEKGWIHASQSERYNRATCRLPDGVEVPRQQRKTIVVGGALRLWERSGFAGIRIKEAVCAWRDRVLRLQTHRDYRPQISHARYEQTSSIRGVALYGGSLHVTVAPSLAQLRRSWDSGLQSVVNVLREFLDGHGPIVSTGAYFGSNEQRRPVRTGQLPLGDVQDSSKQSPRIAKVYDLVNCGPRSRFVIWAGGAPLIVHNCENVTQAVARDCLADAMLTLDEEGIEQLFTVHDEIVCECPYNVHTLADVEAVMARPLPWAPDLPLRGDGFETLYYMKEID